jgi:hypothetical protein
MRNFFKILKFFKRESCGRQIAVQPPLVLNIGG